MTSLKHALYLSAALVLSAHATNAAETIKIGVLNDQSGVFADNGGTGSVAAAKLAAEEFGGEINGQKIEIVMADHQNKPDVAAATARRWFDTDNVDMIADGAASSAGFAILEVARQKNKIFTISGPGSSDFTGKACSPISFHFNYDTYALSKLTSEAITKAGGTSWYFISADYAFGHALQRDATKFIEGAGGKVIGSSAHPLGTADMASFLLQAQGSKAKVVGLATSGADVQTAIKQAGEFGIVESGQQLAGLLVFITDVNALGLKATQGL
ncbi:MAG: ABC transporter substrate-binding protein, partial [Bradyrhizobiaceae bacterium]